MKRMINTSNCLFLTMQVKAKLFSRASSRVTCRRSSVPPAAASPPPRRPPRSRTAPPTAASMAAARGAFAIWKLSAAWLWIQATTADRRRRCLLLLRLPRRWATQFKKQRRRGHTPLFRRSVRWRLSAALPPRTPLWPRPSRVNRRRRKALANRVQWNRHRNPPNRPKIEKLIPLINGMPWWIKSRATSHWSKPTTMMWNRKCPQRGQWLRVRVPDPFPFRVRGPVPMSVQVCGVRHRSKRPKCRPKF